MTYRSTLGIAALAIALVAALGTYLGSYNVAADQPHWSVTARLLAGIRDRSVAARAAAVAVPNLADPQLIAAGAEHYVAMCAGCHLAPDMDDTELRAGMYPKPPNLTESTGRSPQETFWIVKHGIKMSGMPAWGTTHDDDSIWGLVAFLRQLPDLEPAEYQSLVGTSGDDHEHDSQAHDGDRSATADGCTMAPEEQPVGEHGHATAAAHEH